ncbi:DUF3164 family protein [Gramella lutea]|uniref:DUF3164 family protein n=1 Tax=Christiangramia lutea TaxID=1607951 RepID=A0A9X1V4J2_9FLAO|nr:DUF3164 family protein [Christiangramia lutea]MCH4824272.1 DUF3164 family protein [Christiangramia lutea]
METLEKQKSAAEMSSQELEQLLQQRREKEKAEQEKEKKQYEKDKQDFVQHSGSKFKQLHNEMKELKDYTIAEANKLYERMYKVEGKEPKETKSFTLKNNDDTVKVTVDRQERFEFTEEAIVHIDSIKELFKEKYANRNKKLYGYLDELLIKGKTGEYDPKLIVKIRRKAIQLDDEEMLDLINKLSGCQRMRDTALYCRLYIRSDKGKWEDVSLQFSSL